ncbi:hypothetical protein WAX74_20645 [Psychrobacillus sp. FJAT-51614]|uniref:Uncharacterized protein n=1 Tax=Psychrobacillus mangrovi TaxID=3117745 RepID=A0ABU8FAH0_9BACI
MRHIYERSAKYAKLGSILTLGVYIVLVIIFRDMLLYDYETHFLIGFTVFILFSTSFVIQNAADKLQDEQQVDSEYYSAEFPLNELNFQRDVSIIPMTYLVSGRGERLYKIEPDEKHGIKRMLTAISLFQKGMLFPITYNLSTIDNHIVSQFTFINKLKFIQIKIYDHTKKHISTVVMPSFSVKNRAIIFNAINEKMLQMEAKSMYGDIDIDDSNGKRLAKYRFGIFPYATHPAFEIQAVNVHVSLAHDLSHDQKINF